MKKVNLILLDGMRPDALLQCGNPYVQELLATSAYSLCARTVFPSITLPCHMSLFHSVEPGRHGITNNIYTPQVRPVNGIMEQLHGKRSTAMVYNWDELRDLYRPGKSEFSLYISQYEYGLEQSHHEVFAATEKLLREKAPDFCFTYSGWTDEQAHKSGWMSKEYLHALDVGVSSIRHLIEQTKDSYITILVADHGGHDRTHGTMMDEDMLIPVVIHGEGVCPGEITEPVSILDIAPTIIKLLECEPAEEWEGRALL